MKNQYEVKKSLCENFIAQALNFQCIADFADCLILR